MVFYVNDKKKEVTKDDLKSYHLKRLFMASMLNNGVKTLLPSKENFNSKSLYNIEDFTFNRGKSWHNVPSTKEWSNSVYLYNKNSIKTLPLASNASYNLFNSYFNLYPLVNGKKLSKLKLLSKKLSLNRIFQSKLEIKHTNDKVNITVYVYNRSKKTLLMKAKSLNENLSFSQYFSPSSLKGLSKKISFRDRDLISKFSLKPLTFPVLFSYNYKDNDLYLKQVKPSFLKKKALNQVNKDMAFVNKISESKKALMENFNVKTLDRFNAFGHFFKKHYKEYQKSLYVAEALYLAYIREALATSNLFKNWFLNGLKKTLMKLYNKKVELNIVNLKYFYLNSDIFTKAIALRVRNRSNRVLKQMRYALTKVKAPKIALTSALSIKEKDFYFNKDKSFSLNRKKMNLTLYNEIINLIKYKHVNGIKLEGKGRLTPRLTASRSVSKNAIRGNLRNLMTTLNGKGVVTLRGNIKPNLSYTLINSKTRNGAFGLRAWLNNN